MFGGVLFHQIYMHDLSLQQLFYVVPMNNVAHTQVHAIVEVIYDF